MDLNDFWQENKRWVLCCVAGLIIFLIAHSIVGSTYVEPVQAVTSQTNRLYSSIAEEHYNEKQLKQAKADRARIQATLGKLRDAMHYELAERFQLAGKGDPELAYGAVYAAVREEVMNAVDLADVELEPQAFTWSPETDRNLIQRRLIGVSLVSHMVEQLLAAHKAVTDASFEAIGLRSILEFRMDRKPVKRRPTRRRRGEEDKVRAEDLLSEVAVKFKFAADHATIQRFLENCRSARPRVTLGNFLVVQGRRNGDPLVVSGDIRALTIQPLPTDE